MRRAATSSATSLAAASSRFLHLPTFLTSIWDSSVISPHQPLYSFCPVWLLSPSAVRGFPYAPTAGELLSSVRNDLTGGSLTQKNVWGWNFYLGASPWVLADDSGRALSLYGPSLSPYQGSL